MANIQDSIQAAAVRFADEIVAILRGATLSDMLALSGKAPAGGRGRGRVAAPSEERSPRRRRAGGARKRSQDEVTRLADRIAQFLGGAKEEMGVAAIGEALKIPTTDLALPLSKLRKSGKIKAKGQKRNTVYRLA